LSKLISFPPSCVRLKEDASYSAILNSSSSSNCAGYYYYYVFVVYSEGLLEDYS